MKIRALLFFFLLIVLAAPGFAQQLTVQLASGKQSLLTRADFESLPHVKVTAGAGADVAAYEGVTVKSVLEKAGFPVAESLRGKGMALCLVVEAADGYRVVIALPEIDPAFTDKQIDLMFLKDGKPLDEKQGPYRIVIPDEKRMARWVRQVTTLRIVEVQ